MSAEKQISLFASLEAKSNNPELEPNPNPNSENAEGLHDTETVLTPEIVLVPLDKVEGRVGAAPDKAGKKPHSRPAKKRLVSEKQNKAVSTLADRFSSYLSVTEVATRLNISVPTVWRWTRERSDFPRPKKFGTRVSRWLLADLIAFECGKV